MNELQQKVVKQAFNKACKRLNIHIKVQLKIASINIERCDGDARVMFLKMLRDVHLFCNNDESFVKHWLITDNSALGGAPIRLCESEHGLLSVMQYTELMSSPNL